MKHFLSVLLALAIAVTSALPTCAAPISATVITAQKGDTFADLSWQYGVSIDRLLSANGLTRAFGEPLSSKRFHLAPGQRVTMPVGVGFTPSPINAFYYQTQTGDTLGKLSTRFEIAGWAVAKANRLADYMSVDPTTGAITAVAFTRALPAGQTLLIPAGPHVHRLQQGETLAQVASLYGVTTGYLLTVNQLTEKEIVAGLEVTIPAQYDRPFTPWTLSAAPPVASTSTEAPVSPVADQHGPLVFRWIAQNSDFVPSGDGRARATFAAEFKGGQAPFDLYVVNWGQIVSTSGPFLKTDNGQQWTTLDFVVDARCGEVVLLNVELRSADGQRAVSIREFGPVSCP